MSAPPRRPSASTESESMAPLPREPTRNKKGAPPEPTKAMPERSHNEDYAKEYWEKMDNLFYRTVGHAEQAFRINVYINLVVVIVGIVLLGYSIIYSWINSLDLYSTAFGGLGVVNFIAVFYLTPQRKIQKTVGDLTQMQMLYRTYYTEVEAHGDWDRMHPEKTLDQLETMCTQLDRLTSNATEKIEKLIGTK